MFRSEVVRAVVVVLVGVLVSSCSHFTRPAERDDIDDWQTPQWFHYLAERRAGVMVPKMKRGEVSEYGYSQVIVCGEPAPDVAISQVQKLLAEGNVAEKGSGKLSVDLATQALELAGRTQTVLFMREAMYRLCEAYMNGAIFRGDVASLYAAALVTAEEMAKSGGAAAQANASSALAAAIASVSESKLSASEKATTLSSLRAALKSESSGASATATSEVRGLLKERDKDRMDANKKDEEARN